MMDREVSEKLEIYGRLLRKWNPAINLVAPGTLAGAETRHFADSAQMVDFLTPLDPLAPLPASPLDRGEGIHSFPGPVLVDFGSGAGFPGLVLAMARPDLEVHLIESDERKCAFLSTVSRETSTPVTIHNARIESVAPFRADFVTARALAPLATLIEYARPWFVLNPAIACLFLKGRQATAEIEQVQGGGLTFESFPSRTEDGARIVRVTLAGCA